MSDQAQQSQPLLHPAPEQGERGSATRIVGLESQWTELALQQCRFISHNGSRARLAAIIGCVGE